MKKSLADLFRGLQKQMLTRMEANRAAIDHPGAKGGATEINWLALFQDYLPARYKSDKAFVIDCTGELSQEIDVLIYDRQYSPLLFNQDGVLYVPAESVYAVFEVKQDIDKENIEYAGAKAASVRSLARTSSDIRHAGGIYPAGEPRPIMAGFLATSSSWSPPFGGAFQAVVSEMYGGDNQIDFGCVLAASAFDLISSGGTVRLELSGQETALVWFFLRFVQRLQAIGTVPAIDLDQYLGTLQ